MSCDSQCSVALSHGAVGWSIGCDCGIFDHTHFFIGTKTKKQHTHGNTNTRIPLGLHKCYWSYILLRLNTYIVCSKAPKCLQCIIVGRQFNQIS